MSTETETKLARYRRTERESDAFGRIITVRRLRPSERLRITGMGAEFSGTDKFTGSDGEKIEVPHNLVLTVVASVSKIEDGETEAVIPFPRSLGELLAVYDRLDDEGMEAATKAMARLMADEISVNEKDAAKNLSGTPSST